MIVKKFGKISVLKSKISTLIIFPTVFLLICLICKTIVLKNVYLNFRILVSFYRYIITIREENNCFWEEKILFYSTFLILHYIHIKDYMYTFLIKLNCRRFIIICSTECNVIYIYKEYMYIITNSCTN